MKETIIQFGEGNFLRGFAEDFIDTMNAKGLYNGGVVIVKPTPRGDLKKFEAQNNVYNLILRGIENGAPVTRTKEIRCISRCVNPYTQYEAYIALAAQPELRFIISNTTEAGIAFDPANRFTDRPALSFPGKLTQLMYARYKNGLPGFILLPCELIDNNGAALKECVLKYARLWRLGEGFEQWALTKNEFLNTLVDRIVTGYPQEEAAALCEKLGCSDALLDTAEPYHLWAIQGNCESEFPLRAAGVNAVWTNDIAPLKKRKVRLLNGAHTVTVFPALLFGLETVGECLRNDTVCAFLKDYIFGYALPLLGETEENLAFANAVLERFSNPFIRHRLTSIALNSVSKYAVRVAPTAAEHYSATGRFPKPAAFSLAALIYCYKYRSPADEPALIDLIRKSTVEEIVSAGIWGADLSAMREDVETAYALITENKLREAFLWAAS